MTDDDYAQDYLDWCAEDDPDGAALLDELHDAFGRYVVFPSAEAHDATVLWCAATHGQPAWEHAPRLAVISPQKRCGKSRLMDVAEAVCHNVLITVNASVAAVVRSITAEDPPTLMVDEADTLFGSKRAAENNEDVRGILNAGHQRNRPYVRWDITTRSREKCPTFAMAMLASVGDLPDTIMDRAVIVRMRRRGPGETVAPFRTRRDAPDLRALRKRLHAWIRPHIDALSAAVPRLPVEDCAADTWEPMIAVADVAGSHWPGRARQACKAMTASEPDEDGHVSIQLIADLCAVWPANDEYAFTTTLLPRLHQLDESPWAEWGRKREPLKARGLAALLKPYRVRSKTVRVGGETGKGYVRADLHDLRTRYVTSVTASQEGEKPDLTSDDECDLFVSDSFSQNVTWSDQPKQAFCDAVTDVSYSVRKSAPEHLFDDPSPNGQAHDYRRPGCVCTGQPRPCYYCQLVASKQGDQL
ncbi:MAG TPA: DUF3631 domain-containing protein [Mycobacterium sp.]|nr:DUF3631 domain-containing protein [Mycobacterium sp.]HUH70031.1 DUF3631 domain-containing protein [Mycobacterium sp.]